MKRRLIIQSLALYLLFVFTAPMVSADEGMWTFDNLPKKQLKEKYGFEPTDKWLEHIRLSCVRFNDGGSGAFISPKGLVLTNHHVALGQLQKMSDEKNNYVQNGFYARKQQDEIKCPDLELNVLMHLINITDKVQAAVSSGMKGKAIIEAQDLVIARWQKHYYDSTGLRTDVVSLYQGGEICLYLYKKYTDIRLAFAPEQTIAFYGGDYDNFTYPRYNLDMAMFRVYENGEPLKNEHYLVWNNEGAAEDELVFVSGHPGGTDRMQTVSQLEFQRDVELPLTLDMLNRRLKMYKQYAELGQEQARQALGSIFGIENGLKAIRGQYNGLRDTSIMNKKIREEADFRLKVETNKELKKLYKKNWEIIAKAKKKEAELVRPLRYRSLKSARLTGIATQIINYVSQMLLPDEQRANAYRESNKASLELRLFSPAPVYMDLEELMLADGLQESLDQLGPNDPFVKTALNGRSPKDAAAFMIKNTRLQEPEFRKTLAYGGMSALKESGDELLTAVLRTFSVNNEVKKEYNEKVSDAITLAEESLAKARFAVYGKEKNPDANFTLRLSYGKIAGYPMNGTIAPYKTTFYGLYDRAYSFNFKEPFNLPERFKTMKDKLNLSTPFNFVSTCDIIGGNSGSPVINRKGEYVGLVFDGNIESLVGNYYFDNSVNRCVAVHSAAMIHAMRVLYDAGELADEIEGKKK